MGLLMFAAAMKNRERGILTGLKNKCMTPSLPCYITRVDTNTYWILKHIGGLYWARFEIANLDGQTVGLAADIGASFARSCTITSGSDTVACPNTTGLVTGMTAQGLGIPIHGNVGAITANTSFKLVNGGTGAAINATASGTANLTFGIPPYNWHRTDLFKTQSYIIARDSAVSYGGTWADLGSTNPANNIGGLVKYSTATSSTITCADTFGGEVAVYFTGKQKGAYVKVEIDGSGDLCDLLPTYNGYKYVDTYSATDNTYKSSVQVASNVPYGSHTVVLTFMADKNASAGTPVCYYHTAISVGKYPDVCKWRPDKWTSKAYLAYDIIRNTAGRYYICTTAGGGSSTVMPTHTSGSSTLADSYVWWHMGAGELYSSYPYNICAVNMSYARNEWAVGFNPVGGSGRTSIGGTEHGRELRDSYSISVDGVDRSSLAADSWYNGDTIVLTQNSHGLHDYTGSNSVDDIVMMHTFTKDKLNVQHTHHWNYAGEIGYYYPAMWGNLYHWSSSENRYVLRKLIGVKNGSWNFSDYYNTTAGQIYGFKPDYLWYAIGDAYIPRGSGGVPSGGSSQFTLIIANTITPQSVKNYAYTQYKASIKLNTTGVVTVPGTNPDVGKMYFECYDDGAGSQVAVGENWSSSSDYYVMLTPAPISY